MRNEEKLIPIVRARLAERLAHDGLRVRDISRALNVTPAAVTQYLSRKRGRGGGATGLEEVSSTSIDEIINPIALKLARRVSSGLGGIEIAELLDAVRQVMVISSMGGLALRPMTGSSSELDEPLALLRQRLQLELKAAEKYLWLANKCKDDYTKLLLRMIASDSIKHGDVVSQIISWMEAGGSDSEFALPGQDLLENMLSLEDSAQEVSLRGAVKVNHPVARLLLEWIDMDEGKHGRLVGKMVKLGGLEARGRQLNGKPR
jgi:uncharacterized protein